MDDRTRIVSHQAALQVVLMALIETHQDKEGLEKTINSIANYMKSTFDYSPVGDDYIKNFEAQIQSFQEFLNEKKQVGE